MWSLFECLLLNNGVSLLDEGMNFECPHRCESASRLVCVHMSKRGSWQCELKG